jgi:hypothetical protein
MSVETSSRLGKSLAFSSSKPFNHYSKPEINKAKGRCNGIMKKEDCSVMTREEI